MVSGWAAAAVLMIAWLLQSRPVQETPPATAGSAQGSRPFARKAADDTPVAYLSRVSGLGGDSVLVQGYSLAAGREVAIGEGLLELDFFSGARVSIQGPARILPESDMRLTVREGLVQVDVPDSAKGFVLMLPDGTVTDFGTSFEVEVRNGKTSRLQVSRGEVELAGTRDNAAAKRIFQGQALSLADSGGSRPISFSPMAALSFHGLADRVRVDVPGEYPQATFLAWVKVDDLPRRYNGLFLSESGIPGEVHWQFSEDGRFMFGVRPKEFRPDWSFHRAFSEPVLNAPDFGTWRLLATTYDSERREVIHFVDGQEVVRSTIEDSVPLSFGRATLGNFFDPAPAEHANAPGLGENWSFRNWCGAIDEFLLFSRVLGAEEIGRLHEAGRPD